MDVVERRAGDREELARLIGAEKNAKQRDRLRAAALAIDGRETEAIVKVLDRSRRFVQRWAYAYRDGGIEAIKVKKQPGRAVTLPQELHEKFAARIDAGPGPEDRACTLRGREVVKLLEREFGVCYSLSGVYDLLHRLGFSSLRPRPKHRKNDPAAMEAFKKSAPLLSRASARSIPTRRSKSGSRMRPGSGSRGR
jgi:transposase